MKKFILICLLTSFIFGNAQEKKISFAKELNYQMIVKKAPVAVLKMYATNNSEFLTKLNFKDIPMYYFTDGLGTTTVSLEMGNRLNGSLNFLYYGLGNYGYRYGYEDREEFTLETKKLNTKETILGSPCSHYLISYQLKSGEKKEDENVKLCIDDQSSLNNFSVLNGLINQYSGKIKFKSSGMSGLILKAGPEKTYDSEYIVLTSMKDSKDFVYFDHKKAMTEQQREMDSIMLAYKNQEEEYAKLDSTDVLADSGVVAADSAVAVASDPYAEDSYYHIPDYVSEYKDAQDEGGSLAISIIPSESLWKGLPKHCKNFEKDLPEFKNKELKKHLRNYIGQVCDMYLTQSGGHNVGIKVTLDEIRREVLYFNNIHDKLNEADKKKLNNYLNNLD